MVKTSLSNLKRNLHSPDNHFKKFNNLFLTDNKCGFLSTMGNILVIKNDDSLPFAKSLMT